MTIDRMHDTMRRTRGVRGIGVAVVAGCLLASTSVGRCRAADEADAWQPKPGFLQVPEGVKLGACSAVACDPHGRIWVFHRGTRPVLGFDAEGRFLRGWGDDVVGTAHGLRIDPHGHLWATDIGRHAVYEFDDTGKLLRTLGEPGKAGTTNDRFDRPTDVGFGPDGSLFVSDGYGNSRVVKFDKDGKFVAAWGTRGTAKGEFHLPHALLVDAAGRVLVGDRENRRIQVFDATGKLLDVWSGFHPYGLALDAQGRLFVADGRAEQVLQLSKDGQVVAKWGTAGKEPGQFQLPHMLAIDPSGRLHVAEVNGRRIQTFVPTK